MFKKGNQVNKGRIPWNRGVTHSLETKLKMSEGRKKRGTSTAQLEVLMRMSKSNKGRKLNDSQKEALRIANVGRIVTTETREKTRQSLLGMKASEETRLKMSIARKGKPSGRKGEVSAMKGKKQPKISGENHWNWKGGITPANDLIRKSLEYKLWREAVFKRDGFACVIGGKEHGNKLQADHIKPFAWFPELRFAIDNGQTLCEECHRKTPTYAGRSIHYQLINC